MGPYTRTMLHSVPGIGARHVTTLLLPFSFLFCICMGAACMHTCMCGGANVCAGACPCEYIADVWRPQVYIRRLHCSLSTVFPDVEFPTQTRGHRFQLLQLAILTYESSPSIPCIVQELCVAAKFSLSSILWVLGNLSSGQSHLW